MTENLTELYWRDIKDSKPLKRKEEVELFKKAKDGDEKARQTIVNANLRFVVSIASRYKNYGLTLVELISEGNVGLMEAVKRFDETRGFKFITYAVWWIRQAILKSLAEQGKIARPPMSQVNDLQKLEKEAGHLAQRLGRTPTHDELADSVDISAERVRNVVEVSQPDISFDAPAYADEETTMYSIFPSREAAIDDQFEDSRFKAVLTECLRVLDTREYRILRCYFGLGEFEPMTLEQIGQAMGVTRERVRQLRNRALEKLKTDCGELLGEFSRN